MQRKKKRNSLRIRQGHYTAKSPFVQAEKGEWRSIRRKMYRNDKNTRGIPAGNLCKQETALAAKGAFDTAPVNKKPNKKNVYGRRGGMAREKQNSPE